MNIRLFYFCAGNPNRIIAVEKINADVSLGKGGYVNLYTILLERRFSFRMLGNELW